MRFFFVHHRDQLSEYPLARTDLIVESVDDGRIVYVADTQEAHHLDHLAASLWNLCDGTRTPAKLGQHLDCDPATLQATLARLTYAGLLVESLPLPDADRVDRRAMLRRLAIGGAATTVAAGAIMTVDVPSAFAAVSNVQNLILYATGVTSCNTMLGPNLRGTVMVTVAAAGPTTDKLTLVVNLSAYTSGIPANTFDIFVNCGTTLLGTISTGSTGAGAATVTATVPRGQSSVIVLVPVDPTITVGDTTYTYFTKATMSFAA